MRSARLTAVMTCSTVTSMMHIGPPFCPQHIFGFVACHGYKKHGEHDLSGFTTSSRYPNGQTRSGSAGAKIVTGLVPTAAAKCAKPESEPAYSDARSSTAPA